MGHPGTKIVVPDERGRYLIPDLHKAHFRVWVRDYRLVDLEKVAAAPGERLNLAAVVAPSLKPDQSDAQPADPAPTTT